MKWELIKQRFADIFKQMGNGIKAFWDGLGVDVEDEYDVTKYPPEMANAMATVKRTEEAQKAYSNRQTELGRVQAGVELANNHVMRKTEAAYTKNRTPRDRGREIE